MPEHPNDHDLLIELRTEMRGVRTDLKELKESLAQRVKTLEDRSVSRSDVDKLKNVADAVHDDHETRLRHLEAWRWIQVGAASAISSGVATLATNFL